MVEIAKRITNECNIIQFIYSHTHAYDMGKTEECYAKTEQNNGQS